MYAVDTFWHLALGRVIELAGIPTTDLFSAVHPDSPWTQFQWLWEWCAFLLVDTGGIELLRTLNALLLSTTMASAYLIFRRRLNWETAVFLTGALLLLAADRFRVRPDAFNLILFVAGLPYLLWGWRTWGKSRYIFPVALAVLWSNVHGGGVLLWIVCCGTIWTQSAWELSRGRSSMSPFLVNTGIMLCIVGASLLSPTMIAGIAHFTSIYGDAVTQIPNPEWDATWSMLWEGQHPHFWILGLAPYAVLLIGLGLYFKRPRESGAKTLTLQEILLGLGTLYIAHHWVRTAFLAVIALYLITRMVSIKPWLALTLGTLLSIIPLHHQVFNARGGILETMEMAEFDLEPTVYPVEAADFLDRAGLEGKVLNEGKWGGYLIWRTWPQNTYFFDTRHHLTTDMWTLLKGSLSLPNRTKAMNMGFQEYGLELAVFKNGGEPFDRAPEGWKLLFKAGPQVIYQRDDGPNARGNFRRAKRVWRKEGDPVAYGGKRWLNNPWRSREMEGSRGTLKGQFLNARRRYRAGQYREALLEFETLKEREGWFGDLSAWTVGCHLALGHEEKARSLYESDVKPALQEGTMRLSLLLARDLSALPNP